MSVLATPSMDTFHAIDRLRSNSDFLKFEAWLSQCVAEANTALLLTRGGDVVHHNQGYALALHEVAMTIASSKSAIENSQSR